MRDQFDLNPELIYLNSANLSLLPRPVRDAIVGYQRDFERNPTLGLQEAWEKLWGVQKKLARFLQGRPEDLFLRPNVTSVLNTFILGAPLAAEREILVGELEYGSVVNICRWRSEKENRRLRVVKMPQTRLAFQQLTRAALAEAIVSQLSPSTGMLVLSHVIAATGLVLPIDEIGNRCRELDIRFVVDGAYAPGALEVNFSRLDSIDYYGCSLYKWMLGPKGTAFGWVHPLRQEALSPLQAGWTSYGMYPPFSAFGEGSVFQARFLMSGCHDFAPFFAIADTLAFWETHSPRPRIEHLQHFLEQRLTWPRLEPADPTLKGRQSCFLLPNQTAGPGFLAFARDTLRIQLNTAPLQDRWHVILSPHVYNTEEEIAEAVRRLSL